MDKDAARDIAIRLSFRHFIDMRSNRAIGGAAASFESLSGIYLHIREDGSLYIGQAKNIVSRHQQHLTQGHPFEYVAFSEAPPARLDDAERLCIERARRLGCRLANRTAPADRKGLPRDRRPFDDFVPAAAQDDWFAAARSGRTHPARQMKRVESLADYAHQEAWTIFMRHPCAEKMLDAAALYLGIAVPDAASLEGLHWIAGVRPFNFQNRRIPLLWIAAGSRCLFECFSFSQTESAVFTEMLLATSIVCRDEKTRTRLTEKTFNWASWRFPAETALPTPEALLAARTRPAYAKPLSEADRQAQAAELRRPVCQELLLEPVHAAAALEHAPLLLEDPDLAEAAAVGAVASMRAKPVPKPEAHNPIAGHALLSRLGRPVRL